MVEERLAVKFDALSAGRLPPLGLVVACGELHPSKGDLLEEDVEVVMEVYSAVGNLIGSNCKTFRRSTLFGFQTFSMCTTNAYRGSVSRIRVYPRPVSASGTETFDTGIPSGVCATWRSEHLLKQPATNRFDLSQLLERLERFEERLSVRLDALYAHRDSIDCYVHAYGELHSLSGDSLLQDVELVLGAYSSAGLLIARGSSAIRRAQFFMFQTFALSAIFHGDSFALSRIRIYPQPLAPLGPQEQSQRAATFKRVDSMMWARCQPPAAPNTTP